MLNHYWFKRRFKLTKIFKKSKFQFLKIYPKMDLDNLQDLKKLRKIIFSHFWLILDPNLILKKKSSQICLAMLKKAIFLKFQLWVFGRYWPIIGRNVADKVRLAPKSCQNFLSRPDSKIDDFISEKHIPPPKKRPLFFFWGGGQKKILQLIQE